MGGNAPLLINKFNHLLNLKTMSNKPNSLVVLPVKTSHTYHGSKASIESIVTSMNLPIDWKDFIDFDYDHLYLIMRKKFTSGNDGVFRKFKVDEYIIYKNKVNTEVHEYIALKKAEKIASEEVRERSKKVLNKFKAMFGENYHVNGVDFEGAKFSLSVNTSGTLNTDGLVKKFMTLNISLRLGFGSRIDSEYTGLNISENGVISGKAKFMTSRLTANELMEYAEKAKVADDKLNRFAETLKDWAKIEVEETNSVTA